MGSTPGVQSYPRETSPYAKLPVAALDFRVLELHAADKTDDDIQCTLTIRQINSLIGVRDNGIEALSYTWGDATERSTITVNEIPVEVPANLEAFLRHRRLSKASVVLWVDAVCINQADEQEKAQQVTLMSMIYFLAERTLIWLGSASSDSDLAMDQLRSLGHATPYNKLPHLSDEIIEAIHRLFDRPWWTRAWIVQEVMTGGCNANYGDLALRCGNEQVEWKIMVLAAARMMAHREDLRQHFPGIDRILELDSVRERTSEFLQHKQTLKTNVDFIAQYRKFRATDPRDKIFALTTVCGRQLHAEEPVLRPNYTLTVEELYMGFAACVIIKEQSLNVLRHCASRKLAVPSWVPDWSVSPSTTPLPLEVPGLYHGVPWWSEPIDSTDAEGKDMITYSSQQPGAYPEENKRQRELDINRLRLDADGGGMVQDVREIPRNWPIMQSAPEQLLGTLQECLLRGNLVMSSGELDEEGVRDHKSSFAGKQRERLTEKSVKRQLVEELTQSSMPYTASKGARGGLLASTGTDLGVSGIVCDTISVVHEGFPDEISENWELATRFLVAVGQCKALALDHVATKSRYAADEKQLHQAFWLTLLVGRHPDKVEEGLKESETPSFRRCTSWLPPLSRTWKKTAPPVTVTFSGLLSNVDKAQRRQATIVRLINERYGDGPSDASQLHFGGLLSELINDDLRPVSWTNDDLNDYTKKFGTLAELWDQQPYDLYHRPFELLHVVPDPYWNTRKSEDDMALERARHEPNTQIINLFRELVETSTSTESIDDAAEDFNRMKLASNEESDEFNRICHEAVTSSASLVPHPILPRGAEKYALGRKFYITKNGYFGLGPSSTREGDSVVVVGGADVPFVMRGSVDDSANPSTSTDAVTWELLGETYVHGLMYGETMQLVQDGVLKEEAILIR